ncbi:hypothetical protein [Salinimicrobium terrae]|uniref:hypothetical protein n=1 Tax=Salinimicrobium terrae TaxID=470866 RepID=UPI0004911CF7|nr:hypothetical protein [Salinimicrobium terrae]
MELLQLNSEVIKKEGAAVELELLLKELCDRELSEDTVTLVNKKIGEINNSSLDTGKSRKQINAARSCILNHLEKKHGLVSRNHYATLWLPLGMSAFGLPIGALISIITGNVAFIGVGLPIGIGIGSFYGASLDKKAEREGRVLNYTRK